MKSKDKIVKSLIELMETHEFEEIANSLNIIN